MIDSVCFKWFWLNGREFQDKKNAVAKKGSIKITRKSDHSYVETTRTYYTLSVKSMEIQMYDTKKIHFV